MTDVKTSRHDVIIGIFWSGFVSLVKSSYWSKFHVNIITGSGIMTIFFCKGLTRNPEIGKIWLPPLIKGGRVGPSKNWVTWGGYEIFCYKGGINLDVEMGELPLFLLIYSSVQSHLHFRIFGLWVSHARFSTTFSSKSCTKTWYHLYISDLFW